MEQYNNFNRAMKADIISKNRRSSKSQMNRVNLKVRQIFSNLSKTLAMNAITAMCLVGTVKAQTEPNIQQSIQTPNTPLIIVEGIEIQSISSPEGLSISSKSIGSFEFLTKQSSIEQFGERGKNGVVIFTMKK